MTINHYTGVISDAITYNFIFFNPERARAYFKIYLENESDIFENYFEFRKKYAIDPSDNLFPFFYCDTKIPCVIKILFDNHFDFFDGTVTSFLNLLKDKNFKRIVYYHYLDPLKKDIDIEAVLKGDAESTSYAVALLSAIHADYPKSFHLLFYKFDELIEELIAHMKTIIQKTNLYHGRKKNLFEGIVKNFLNSENINVIRKNYYDDRKIDFTKQIYAISLFNRIIIKTTAEKDKRIVLLIGDKCSNTPTLYANYSHVTDLSAATTLSTETMRDIIGELEKGEKSITQLSMILPYARPTIDKFIGRLYDELAIKVSRKSGNEIYYEINHQYFIAAKEELIKACDKIINGKKKN